MRQAAIAAVVLVGLAFGSSLAEVHARASRERAIYATGFAAGECQTFRGAVKNNPALLWPGKPDVKAALDICDQALGK